jgi:uncharacterized protein YdaU (DUF1376 family)
VGHKSGSSQRPWFQFYAQDFLGSTLAWTDEQVGAYLRLLSHQWINGEVPFDDPKKLARISDSAAENITLLRSKFPDGLNPRLEKIRDAMVDRSEQGRIAAQARWGSRQDSPDDDPNENQGDADAHAGASAAGHADASADAHAAGDAGAMVLTPTPTLRSKSTPRSKPGSGGPISEPMWDAFRATYPERQGTQGWSKAKVKAAKLIASGEQWADIMAGARRYRDQQQAAGKIGSEFIKRAEFFLAADARLWTEEYPISQTNERTSKNVAAAKRFIDAG